MFLLKNNEINNIQYNLYLQKIGDIVKMADKDKYCLNNRIKVLWTDKTFGLAKVLFIEEWKIGIIGIGLISDQPNDQSTLSISVLTGG